MMNKKELDADENELELRVGDYISEPNDEEIYSDKDFVLSQIVRNGDKYTRLFVEKLIVNDYYDEEGFDTLEEVESYLRKGFSLIKKLRVSAYHY